MRVINEIWTGVGFAVEQGEQQKSSPEGLPMFKPNGEPEMEATTVIVLVDQAPGVQHVIRVPLNEEGRMKLRQSLSRGVIVANGMGDLKHLDGGL